jgi:tRNA (guanine-N7-)-methyltransferase
MSAPRDIRGALNGSRFIEQPHIRPEVEATRAFVAGDGPVLVEVGFDHGRRLHSMARHNPNWRFLGVEVRKQRVQEARERAARDMLINLRPWRMDARIVFAGVLSDASVDVVEVLFPTPWWDPAKREKRLLITNDFVTDVIHRLRPGGVLHVATDVVDYARHIEAVLAREELINLSEEAGRSRLPLCTQQSRREWKCERAGIPVFRWICARTA